MDARLVVVRTAHPCLAPDPCAVCDLLALIAECRRDVAKIEQHTRMEIGGADKYEQFRKWVRGRCLALLSRIDALGKETRDG